ncbi:NHLM bacteriocin system secretion protein [Tistlia consotensis]|uniref:NHLM bacteriocin system secretion protein n=1 Tax=Tistlia consotensis USBA 355 TaxID=560819 RepID=A0A1Y6BCF3_9PROT|nr:NHLP bacteriocin system secretion protein [Tistlia consotensis]SMF04077.1 NHLM bacteriocin system secretion protein [Tistlia consotensis USBA 355]SNR54238.1 NHLM bacteriocin system secretion protein [Tistlia consotensis]
MLSRRKQQAAPDKARETPAAGATTPGDIGRLAHLTSARGWIVALTLAVATFGAVVWGFLGQIRIEVSGLGVIEYKHGVLQELTAPSGGRLERLAVRAGSRVSKGDLIAVLRVGTDREDLRGAQRLLSSLRQERDRREKAVHQEIEQRKETAKATIQSLEDKAAVLEQRVKDYRPYLAELEKQMKQGLVLRDRVEQVRSDLNNARVDLATAHSDIQNARANLSEFIANQQSTLGNLDDQIVQAENKVDNLQAAIAENSRIIAPHEGLIIAIEASEGDQLSAGSAVAQLEGATRSLLAYGYFRPGDGKRVSPGMKALVSPNTVEPEIYGTILGTVVSVGEQPATEAELRDQIDNDSLVQQLLKGGAPIEVQIALEDNPKTESGLAWTSSVGPPHRVTAGTTASAKVAVQEQAPISFIIPIFGTWLGGGGG